MMSSEAVHLGGFMLPWSLLIIVIGLASVFILGMYFSHKYTWPKSFSQTYHDSIWTSLWIGLIVARAVFVLANIDVYFDHPMDIIKIQDKGFNLYAGMIGACVWFIWKNRLVKPTFLMSSIFLFVFIQIAGHSLRTSLSVEQQYPELTFLDLTQQPQSLTQFVGQPTVINLWASWCPPCHREMPVLSQAEKDHANVQFVMLNQGEEMDVIADYLQRYQFDFKYVLTDKNGDMAQHMNMFGLPSTLFFNAQGQLVERHQGELSHAMLKQYLQKIKQSQEVLSP